MCAPHFVIHSGGNNWDASLANVVESDWTMPDGSCPDGESWNGAHDMTRHDIEWMQNWFQLDDYRDHPIRIRMVICER